MIALENLAKAFVVGGWLVGSVGGLTGFPRIAVIGGAVLAVGAIGFALSLAAQIIEERRKR